MCRATSLLSTRTLLRDSDEAYSFGDYLDSIVPLYDTEQYSAWRYYFITIRCRGRFMVEILAIILTLPLCNMYSRIMHAEYQFGFLN